MTKHEAFAILGVSENADAATIREAYRDLAKVWHPDRFLGDERLRAKGQERLKEINVAYEYLRSTPRGNTGSDSTSRHARPSETREESAAADSSPRPSHGSSTRPPPAQQQSTSVGRPIWSWLCWGFGIVLMLDAAVFGAGLLIRRGQDTTLPISDAEGFLAFSCGLEMLGAALLVKLAIWFKPGRRAGVREAGHRPTKPSVRRLSSVIGVCLAVSGLFFATIHLFLGGLRIFAGLLLVAAARRSGHLSREEQN